MVATERLLVEFALLPVPVTLTAALIGKSALTAATAGATSAAALSSTGATASGGAVKLGLFAQIAQAVGAHPVAAIITAGALVAGAAVGAANLPPSSSPSSLPASTGGPAASTAGTGDAAPLTLGPRSLESANASGLFVSTVRDLGVLVPVDAGVARERVTFEVTLGLAEARCFSFRAVDGRYLRHSSWRLRLSWADGTPLFRGDATFCARPGAVAGSVSLESSNYPGWFLRHLGDELWVGHSDGTADFRADSAFLVRPPVAG
jgi:hypothetical protein